MRSKDFEDILAALVCDAEEAIKRGITLQSSSLVAVSMATSSTSVATKQFGGRAGDEKDEPVRKLLNRSLKS